MPGPAFFIRDIPRCRRFHYWKGLLSRFPSMENCSLSSGPSAVRRAACWRYRPPINQAVPARSELRSIARHAVLQRGMLPDFSAAVLAQTGSITRAAAESGASIRDLRSLLWASIAVPSANGAVKILVAVADVDAIVKRDTAIDGHARANTTSVYTAAEIFPMLPEKLSTDLTSLGEHQKAAEP